MAGTPRLVERKLLLDAAGLRRVLKRLAAAIAGAQRGRSDAVLVGIQTRGVPLARRLAGLLDAKAAGRVAVGTLDITLYRDDLTQIASQPVIKRTDIPVSIDGRSVILVDDVLYTGRTIRAALDELIDFGRPSRILLCALVDRGGRELPIQPDFVGLKTAASADQSVQVRLQEEDGEDRVVLLGPAPAPPRRREKRRR